MLSPSRKVAALVLASSLGLLGCPAEPGPPPIHPLGGDTPIDVQRLRSRPRLSLVRRQGDPIPFLALATATDRGAVANAALAGVLQARLASWDAEAVGDGAGLRLLVPMPASKSPRNLFAGLVAALAPSVSREEHEAAEERVAALRRSPLDAAALAPLARCTGRPAALAKEARPPSAEELDEWLAALSAERMALAFVGPAEEAEEVRAALSESSGWPTGQPAAPTWPDSSHGAFLTTTLPANQPELQIALRSGDALGSVAAARRMRRPSPLSNKLALLSPPWRLDAVTATAHAAGGCLFARLSPAIPVALESVAAAAGQAAALAEAELHAEQALGGPTFGATREILAAATARDTAERAAWWALHERTERASVSMTALAVGASDRGGPVSDDESLRERYVRAITADSGPPHLERRLALERGQGELWLLVATPCALLHEEIWDAGRSALAAAAVVAQSEASSVELEPWVTADGVGLLAHGALLRPDEPPSELATRVADAAGRALSSLPRDHEALRAAKRVLLPRLADERSAALFAAATRVVPNHPSWLTPWGAKATAASTTREDAMLKWRSVLALPFRVAVLANVDEAQGKRVATRLERWLPRPSASRCTETSKAAALQPGTVELRGDDHLATVLAAADARQAGGSAELVAAALEGEILEAELGAIVERTEVRVAGSGRSRTLVVMVQTAADRRDEAKKALRNLFEQLSSSGLPSAALTRARERLELLRQRTLAHPAARVARLWQDGGPAGDGEVASWTRTHLAPERLVWAVDEE